MQLLSWTTTVLSLSGVVLNIKRQRVCFYLWGVSNASWCLIDAYHGIWAQSALQAVYLGLSVWGIVAWKEKP